MSNMENEVLNESAEEIVERPYTLRKMKDSDLFPVLDIITKVFPDDLTSVFAKLVSGEKNASELGAIAVVQLVRAVLMNVDTVKDDLYAFLSDVSGIQADGIKEMPFGTTPMMIWDIASDVKNASFFKVVSKLF